MADAVVLAVPLSRQKTDALADLSRQLGEVRHNLLPVVTSPARRAARGAIVSADGVISMPGLAGKQRVDLTSPSGDNGTPAAPEGEAMMFGGQAPGNRPPPAPGQ